MQLIGAQHCPARGAGYVRGTTSHRSSAAYPSTGFVSLLVSCFRTQDTGKGGGHSSELHYDLTAAIAGCHREAVEPRRLHSLA